MHNAAARYLLDAVPAIGTAAADEVRRGVADHFRLDDRRRLVALPDEGPNGFVDGVQAFFELGLGQPSFSVVRIVATRGDRLALGHNRIEFPSGDAVDVLSLVQLTTDLTQMEVEVTFDVDDEAAAVTELDRMHRSIE